MDGILDTTVLIHLLRHDSPALDWLSTDNVYGITTITWLEVMEGTRSKADQTRSKEILDHFQLLYLTTGDQKWAMQQLEHYQFSSHIGMNDCLIAAVAYRVQLPLFTHNLKHMTPLVGSLAQQPY